MTVSEVALKDPAVRERFPVGAGKDYSHRFVGSGYGKMGVGAAERELGHLRYA